MRGSLGLLFYMLKVQLNRFHFNTGKPGNFLPHAIARDFALVFTLLRLTCKNRGGAIFINRH
jgi:hypothetical protein